MKKFSLFVLLSMFMGNISAQDVIVKKDGSTILSKVMEVGSTEVKYKKYSNLDGPLYTISKSELFKINYENGNTDDFKSAATSVESSKNTGRKSLFLRSGTEVPIQIVSPIKARDVTEGQEIAFRTVNDFFIDGEVVFPAGTPVKGIVYEAKKSSWFGTKGRLGIKIDHLTLNDGFQIPLKGNIYVTGKNRTALSVTLFLFVTIPACFICGTKAQLLSGYETMAKVAANVRFSELGLQIEEDLSKKEISPNTSSATVQLPVKINEKVEKIKERISDYPYKCTIYIENKSIKAGITSIDTKQGTIHYKRLNKSNELIGDELQMSVNEILKIKDEKGIFSL